MENRSFMSGIILLLIVTFLWGAAFPIAKNVLNLLDGFYFAFIRYAIGSVAFLGVLLLLEGKQSFSFENTSKMALFRSGLVFAGFNIFCMVGLSYTTPIQSSIIVSLTPLMTIMIQWIFNGEKPSSITLICILLAIAGVMLVITKGNLHNFQANHQIILGDLLTLIGVICWAVYTLTARYLLHWSGIRYTTMSITVGTFFLGVIALCVSSMGYIHTPTFSTIWSQKFSLLYLGLIAGVIAILSWNHGIKKLGASNGVLFMNLVPIFVLIMGLMKGQLISTPEIIGFCFTLFALIMNNIHNRLLSSNS